jgi:hypothetical protein
VIAQRVALAFALAIILIGLLSIAFRLEKTAYLLGKH